MNILHICILTCALTSGFPQLFAQAQDKVMPISEAVLQSVKLSELEPESTLQGWGGLGKNVSVDGRQLTVGERKFEHGLGTHATSELVFMLHGQYEKFESWIGLDNEVRMYPDAAVVFQVFVDGKMLFDSGIMKADTPAKQVGLSVTGVKQLKLVVNDGGNGTHADHADWAEPILLATAAQCAAQKEVRKREEELLATPVDCAVTLKVVAVHPEPVIKKGDSGTEDNKYGFEGGSVLRHQGAYHLFTAERFRDPYDVKMRLGHWTSADGLKWARLSTIRESSAEGNGMDLRASIWAPMPFYDEAAKLWNMYYVAYRSKGGDDSGDWFGNYAGRIVHSVSQVAGPDGLNGPWNDLGVALEPEWEPWSLNPSQPWEGLQGTDSISPPYAAGGKWYAFYGSAQMQNPSRNNPKYPRWSVGLAEAPAPTGPWKRRAKGNPMPFGGFAENPIVTQLQDGSYVMVCDSGFIGYAWSPDGLRWSKARNIEVPKDMQKWWDGGTRTPLGCVPESDGTYTIFFMAHRKNVNWQELGLVRVKVER